LKILADLLKTKPSFISKHAFEWQWLKPANSAWLPLHTDAGYASLLKQLKAPPQNVSSTYIIIQMAEPVKKPVDPGIVMFSTLVVNRSDTFS
jgi:hypothetical protein